MIPANDKPEKPRASKSNRSQSGKAMPGYRIVHVAVAEEVFNHAKAQAYLSGLSWPEFVARVLKATRPIVEVRR